CRLRRRYRYLCSRRPGTPTLLLTSADIAGQPHEIRSSHFGTLQGDIVNLQFDARHEAFREEVRAFLRENLSAEIVLRTRVGMHPPDEDDRRWWNRVLYERGWSAPHWPAEYGGAGWDPIQIHIFEHECRAA